MGIQLLNYYKNNIKRTWKTAFFSAFFLFLLVHLYKITNTLPNHDSYFNVYTDQDMTRSGRWFLQFACGISSYHDLDWVIGLLCACWLGLTNAVLTELFDLKNPFVIGLTGAILAACPSTTETLFFGFTADGYLLGLALAALSACLTCRAKTWRHNVLGGICLCLCCAIYQSCVSFAVVLCICWLVMELLEDRITLKNAWRWIGRHVLVYILALAAYYLIWKAALVFNGEEAVSYQGIDQVGLGSLQIGTMLNSLIQSVMNLLFFFVEWNILEHPITLYGVLNILFLLCFAGIVIAAVVKSGILRRPGSLVLMLIALIASVPMISIWCFLSAGVQYRPMMLHSAVLYYILAVLLFDRWTDARRSTAFGLAMCVMVFNFAIMANISYNYLNYCKQQTYYEGIQMMVLVDEIGDEYGEQVEGIAFAGSRKDAIMLDHDGPAGKLHILSALLEESLLQDQEHIYPYLSSTFDLELFRASGTQLSELQKLEAVQALAAWPEENCWTVVDNILVINLEE